MIENTLKPKDKVKINPEAFAWQVNSLTPKFLKYINDNANTVFTLKSMVLMAFFGNLKKILHIYFGLEI
jgi:hypothetical protein